MTKVIALGTVHLCTAPGEVNAEGKIIKAAKIDVKVAGDVFDLDEDEFEDLEGRGAVRAASSAEVKAAGDDAHVDLPVSAAGERAAGAVSAKHAKRT